MVRRKVRDIYGNWVYEDVEEQSDSEEMRTSSSSSVSDGEDTLSKEDEGSNGQDSLGLEWRDWLALTFAYLQTVFLPIVVFMIVLLVIVILFMFPL